MRNGGQSRIGAACVIALALVSTSLARADGSCSLCTCVTPGYDTPEEAVTEALHDAEAVFFGQVVDIRTPSGTACVEVEGCADVLAGGNKLSLPQILVSFDVESSWKGIEEGESSLSLSTSNQASACGYPFEIGRWYLVYAYDHDESGERTTNACARTRPMNEAAFDLGVLGR